MRVPTIAISLGHPGGIGPEVVVKALADRSLRDSARFVILGHAPALERAACAAAVSPFWSVAGSDWAARGVLLIDQEPVGAEGMEPRESAGAGRASLAWFEHAIRLAQLPASHPHHAHAIVTGPISKASWALAGERTHHGHTGLLAARCGDAPHVMMFVSPVVNVALVTDHIPLGQVSAHMTSDAVLKTITLATDALARLGTASPRVAVCGLNPHAGEGSTIGAEDARVIAPAVAKARGLGIDAQGPFPADTIFRRAVRTPAREPDFDLVIAMYHDQGLIPVKLVAMEHAVNLTAGLPIMRTSPDHGTAFDIAGLNRADPRSMSAAVSLAINMASNTAHSSKL